MQKPRLALRVRNLESSLAFYTGTLSWTVEWQEGAAAQLRMPHGGAAILAEDASFDFKPHMDVAYSQPKLGQRVYLPGSGLRNLDIPGATLVNDGGFWLALLIPDPDGYIMALSEELQVSDEEILDLYRQGPDLLEEALAGLSAADLDLVRAPGKWSIRQITLHLIDSDLGSMYKTRFALAEPGRAYTPNPYSQDRWAEGLDYANRLVQTEVALFRLARQHILGLVNHLPDALERTVVMDGRPQEVRTMLKMVAGHARGHIEQIWETRKLHGK